MSVGIVLPWRDTSRERAKAMDTVVATLKDVLPEAVLIPADSWHQDFNRAASRNVGVREAQKLGCGVVVVCDADSIPEAAPLRDAIAGAPDGLLHLPYTRFVSLSPKGTAQYLSATPWWLCHSILDWGDSVGGCWVMTPEAWFAAGGQDERFLEWGCEDTAFKVDCDNKLGATVRHGGTLVHLYHPATRELKDPATALLAEHL